MYVSVRGAKDRKLAGWLRCAANFYADELMHKNLVKNINLRINIVALSKNFTDKGQCEWDDIDGPPNPRYFTITLARPTGDSMKELFSTLAHEMVHLKQYAKNEMSGLIGDDHFHLWKGTPYKLNSKLSPKKTKGNKIKIRSDGSDYYYCPWEIEAYGLEVGLFAYFCQKYGVDNYVKDLTENHNEVSNSK